LISDANLPTINTHRHGVCKPVVLDFIDISTLPGLIGIKHVKHWNMSMASDMEIMRYLFSFAESHPDSFLIFFTRDVGFLYDANVDIEDLQNWNMDVIILQSYVPYLQQQGYKINHNAIGYGSRAFLQEVMKRIYLIWRQQH